MSLLSGGTASWSVWTSRQKGELGFLLPPVGPAIHLELITALLLPSPLPDSSPYKHTPPRSTPPPFSPLSTLGWPAPEDRAPLTPLPSPDPPWRPPLPPIRYPPPLLSSPLRSLQHVHPIIPKRQLSTSRPSPSPPPDRQSRPDLAVRSDGSELRFVPEFAEEDHVTSEEQERIFKRAMRGSVWLSSCD